MSRSRSVIVIPFYNNILNEGEWISLQQAVRIFCEQPVFFAAPEHLAIEQRYLSLGLEVQRFPDYYFADVKSYSQLLTSELFYKAFSDYEYLLIYQLDAFCFSNRLNEFCNLGYDYYGAVVPKVIWPWCEHRVGNGGLSLRKTSACLQMVQRKEEVLKRTNELPAESQSEVLNVEDQYFSFCGNQPDFSFHLAPYDVAFDFSVEFNVSDRYDSLADNPPFGCHRWYQANIEIWWQYIKKYGYRISDEFYQRCFDNIPGPYYLEVEKYIHASLVKDRQAALESIFAGKSPVIWGYGVRGKRLYRLLTESNIILRYVIDQSAEIQVENITVLRDIEKLPSRNSEYLIIVSPEKEKWNIIEEIKKIHRPFSYITYNQLLKEIGKLAEIGASFD